jgi:hypothetical protein
MKGEIMFLYIRRALDGALYICLFWCILGLGYRLGVYGDNAVLHLISIGDQKILPLVAFIEFPIAIYFFWSMYRQGLPGGFRYMWGFGLKRDEVLLQTRGRYFSVLFALGVFIGLIVNSVAIFIILIKQFAGR